MKTVKLLSVLTIAILVGCGEKVNELSHKKETLKELTYGKLAESDANLVENVGKALDKIPNMGGIYVG